MLDMLPYIIIVYLYCKIELHMLGKPAHILMLLSQFTQILKSTSDIMECINNLCIHCDKNERYLLNTK